MSDTTPTNNCNQQPPPATVGKGCPCPKLKDLINNTDQLAKTMGMNEKCKTEASNSSTSASVSANANAFIFSAAAQGSMTQMNEDMKSSGCGDFFLNSQNILTNNNSISCTLNDISQNSSAEANENATINIKTLPISTTDQKTIDDINNSIVKLTLAQQNPKYSKVLEDAIDRLSETAQVIANRDITITNSTLKNDVKTTIKQISTIDTSTQTKLVSDYKNIAKAAAVQSLQSTLGTQALPPNTRSIVNDNVENNTSNINNTIQEIVQKNTTTVNQNGNITMQASGNVTIKDSYVGNDLQAQIVSKAITQSAIAQGVAVASNMVNDATSDTSSKSISKGIEDLANALGKANSDAIAKSGKAGSISPIAYIVIGICGLVALFFFGMAKGILPPVSKGPKAMIGWVMGIIMIVALIFVIWWFFFHKKKKKNDDDNKKDNN